jgi:O-antigen ligase
MAMIPIVLYLIALYVRPQDWVPGLVGLPTAYIIIPLGLVVGFAIRAQDPDSHKAPQNGILFVYLGIIFISTLVNTDVGQAYHQLDLFAKRVAVFFIVIWIVNSVRRVEVTIWTCLLLSGFLAYQAILQANTGQSWGGQTPEPGYAEIRVRWYGDWDGPNVYALLFVMAFGMAMEYLLGPHGIIKRAIALVLCSAFLGAIFYTNSRGAILGVVVMLMFYFRSRFRSVFALAAAALLVGAILAFGPSRMSQVSSKESSAHERTWLWEQGLTLLRNNPVLGVGRGQFARRVDLRLIAHNNFVQNFAETGLTGFLCFCLLLWYSFKGNRLASDPRFKPPPPIAAQGRILMSVLVGYTAVTFFVVMELDLFYFLLGLCCATYLVARRNVPEIPKMTLSMGDLGIVLAGMAAILMMIWLAAVKQIL